MDGMNFKTNFHWHGVNPNIEFSINEKNKILDEFVSNYNYYCEITNAINDKINHIWNGLESAKATNNEKFITEIACAMGVGKDCTYCEWVKKVFTDITDQMNIHGIGKKLESFIFMDGDIPVYGARFKEHPEWTIDFTLESVE